MANLFRLIAGVMFACLCVLASHQAAALEVIETYPPNTCNAANHPSIYAGDSNVTATWICGIGGNARQCGWKFVAPAYGWDGTAQNGVISGQCTLPEPVYSCPANATLGTNAHGARTCTCNTGFREYNGQCTNTPPNCELGFEWSDVAQTCVLKPCAPNETRVNGICVPEPPCPAGQTRVNGKCEPDKCPKAGSNAGEGWEMSSAATEYACESTGVSFEGSVQYCMIKVVNNMDVSYNGKTFYYGRGTYTGAQCSGGSGGGDSPGSGDPGQGDPGSGDPGTGPGTGPDTGPGTGPTPPDPDRPPPPPPPSVPPGPDNHCPAGTQRYSDGKCYAPTPPPTQPDQNGSCPPGSMKVGTSCVYPSPPGKPVPEPPNPDGSCPPGFHPVSGGAACVKDPEPPTDGTCPVGTHMVNGQCVWNGGVTPPPTGGGDGDGDGDGDGKSGFGGNCEAGFACEGDAIFCAIAKEQHRRACRLFDNKTAESELYEKEKGKTGEQTKDLPGNREESMANRISTADAFGAGQCVQDLNIVVVGKSVTLPMSKICPIVSVLGNIMVGVALLLAVRIVGRG